MTAAAALLRIWAVFLLLRLSGWLTTMAEKMMR